jgi:rhamnogalacturonan endolyase
MEYLDRGLVAVKCDEGVFLSWRLTGDEDTKVAFNVYRNQEKINEQPVADVTNWVDAQGTVGDKYVVKTLVKGKEVSASNEVTPWDKPFLVLQMNRPTLDSAVLAQIESERLAQWEQMRQSPQGQQGRRGQQAGQGRQGQQPRQGQGRQGQQAGQGRQGQQAGQGRQGQQPRQGQGGQAPQQGQAFQMPPFASYLPNDCSVGDLDGDGTYEIIVKWDARAQDNSRGGVTDPVILDAYKLDGTQLWRIDLGKNIRAGAHYTQFMVYDLDGDGIAEVVCKTAPGTKDGTGKYVILGNDDPNAVYRNETGFILDGPEYLTVFNGATGAEITTIPYNPPRGDTMRETWGDNSGNRVDRYLACIAYLDGVHPSVVMCRGYYTRAVLAAYDFDGKTLKERWVYDSGTERAPERTAYGQGNHSIAPGDIDGDGFDEITYGAACIDHDGTLLYTTALGHGDAHHLSDMDPDRPGLEYFQVHESRPSPAGVELRDPKTGTLLFGRPTTIDVGRGIAADIDPRYKGFEFWSSTSDTVYNVSGKVVALRKPSVNFRIYWDDNLQDELLDGTKLDKWAGDSVVRIVNFADFGARSINGTKQNPSISADLFGDWREEVVLYNGNDPSQLMIFTTTIPTQYKLYTLMHNPLYRLSVAAQNVAYNQPPHLDFYIGDGLDNVQQPAIKIVKKK